VHSAVNCPEMRREQAGLQTRLHRTFVKESVKFLLVVVMLAASQAHGEIYVWKDSRGVNHYTNRRDDIPVRYRPDAKAMEYDREPKSSGLPVPGNDAGRAMPLLEEQRSSSKAKNQRPMRQRE